MAQAQNLKRILFCGDVNGNYSTLSEQLRKINEKQGPFDFLLICGNFSGVKRDDNFSYYEICSEDEELMNSEKTYYNRTEFENFKRSFLNETFVIPVYFIDSGSKSNILSLVAPNGTQISQNLYFLGSCGLQKIQGLNIAYLSGKFNLEVSDSKLSNKNEVDNDLFAGQNGELCGGCSSNENVDSIRELKFREANLMEQIKRTRELLDLCSSKQAKVDILITCEWPEGIFEGFVEEQSSPKSNFILNDLSSCSTIHISYLSLLIEPRYHFASNAKIFYQRPPFHGVFSGHVCKFIGLGEIGRKEKEHKAVHALLLTPMKEMQIETLFYGSSQDHNTQKELSCINPLEQACKKKREVLSIYNFKGYNKFESESETIDDDTIIKKEEEHFSNNDSIRYKRGIENLYGSPSEPINQIENLPPNFVDPCDKLDKIKKVRREEKCDFNRLGRTDNLDIQNEKSERQSKGCVLCVKNLPYSNINETSLRKILESFGKIKMIRMPRNEMGNSIGKAWVVYCDAACAEAALKFSEQIEAGNRKLILRIWHGRIPYPHISSGSKNNSEIIDVQPHDDCWFCLANPKAEKHLVVRVGKKVYLSIAKGGLNDRHVLIIPINHCPNFLFLDDDVASEIESYIDALRLCFRKQNLETIVYERFVPMKHSQAMHMQIQVIPLPEALALDATRLLVEKAKELKLSFNVLPQYEKISFIRKAKRQSNAVHASYFYSETPGDISAKGRMVDRHFFTCESGVRLPINFGREILATLMNDSTKVEWKNCVVDSTKETIMAQEMGRLFAPFASMLNID